MCTVYNRDDTFPAVNVQVNTLEQEQCKVVPAFLFFQGVYKMMVLYDVIVSVPI